MNRSIAISLPGPRVVQITPRWVGSGLAVHKEMLIDSNDQPQFVENNRGIWVITHVHTGLNAGMFHGNLQKAIAFAREWDEPFAAVTTTKVPRRLRQNYLAALRRAKDRHSKANVIY